MKLLSYLFTVVLIHSLAQETLAKNNTVLAQDVKPFYATGVIGNAGDNLADVIVRKTVDQTTFERVRVENPTGLNDFGWLRFVAKNEDKQFRLYRCDGTVDKLGVFQPKARNYQDVFTTYGNCFPYLESSTLQSNYDLQVRTGFYFVTTDRQTTSSRNNIFPGIIEVRRNKTTVVPLWSIELEKESSYEADIFVNDQNTVEMEKQFLKIWFTGELFRYNYFNSDYVDSHFKKNSTAMKYISELYSAQNGIAFLRGLLSKPTTSSKGIVNYPCIEVSGGEYLYSFFNHDVHSPIKVSMGQCNYVIDSVLARDLKEGALFNVFPGAYDIIYTSWDNQTFTKSIVAGIDQIDFKNVLKVWPRDGYSEK